MNLPKMFTETSLGDIQFKLLDKSLELTEGVEVFRRGASLLTVTFLTFLGCCNWVFFCWACNWAKDEVRVLRLLDGLEDCFVVFVDLNFGLTIDEGVTGVCNCTGEGANCIGSF